MGVAVQHVLMRLYGNARRDIKPENILVMADNTLRIADFGLAVECDEKGHTTKRQDTMT